MIGEVLEMAIWLDGTETLEHVEQWKHDCSYMMSRAFGNPVLKLAPCQYFVKYPGEDRVPVPPPHIKGPNVRLLVAEALVVGFEPEIKTQSFLADLEPKDLELLRACTRKAWNARNRDTWLTDDMCDQIIEEMGPQAAVQTLRSGYALH